MTIPMISIGNSKGILLSKTLIEKYNLKDTVELVLENGYIILRAKNNARKGWEKSFKKMREKGDDIPLMADFFKDENFKESI